MEHIESIIEEMLNNISRDKYSERQNDYCDGYEFALLELKDKLSKTPSATYKM